jgi:hypothetical protein
MLRDDSDHRDEIVRCSPSVEPVGLFGVTVLDRYKGW